MRRHVGLDMDPDLDALFILSAAGCSNSDAAEHSNSEPAMVRASSIFALATAIALSTASSSLGQSQYDLAKIVIERNGEMLEMQTAFWPLFNINNDKSTDLAAAVDAIKTIDENFARFLELLPEGTAGGQVPGSRAKPEIWTEPSEFSAVAERLRSATSRLSEVASTGDIDAFKLEFATFQPACFGCHDLKGSSGGQFRFATTPK
jgi:cytochrome c556